MADQQAAMPDTTAVLTALWRAIHVQDDPPPHVLADEIGLQLAAPSDDWRRRPEMDPRTTRALRAAIVARARFIEDLITEQADCGVTQCVILGAGLDTFTQRRPEVASRLHVFEVDRPGPQAWKRRRLIELGYGVPDWLHLVSVDFEASEDWLERLRATGFDPGRPAVVVSTGVTMYLTKDATTATLRQIAKLAPGSTLAMTFLLPIEFLDEADRPGLRMSKERAQAIGTPFISSYTPHEMLALAQAAGLENPRHLRGHTLARHYFADRTDGLRPSSGEDLLMAGI